MTDEQRLIQDTISLAHYDVFGTHIEDGTYRVNTLSLNIGGDEIIDSNRYIKPVRIVNESASGLIFYASDGITKIAELDESGNLLLLGGVGSL